MNKIRISASEFISDVKSGKSDGELMEKYGLSVRSLPRIKQELVKRNLLSSEEAGTTESASVAQGIAINAKEFLQRFRNLPDDVVLMDTYSINPTQLNLIYQTLIKKGLLSEYEYEHRDGKCSELEEMPAPEREDSTSVTLKELISRDMQDRFKTAVNHSEFRQASGPSSSFGSNPASDIRRRMQRTLSHEPDLGTCPNCNEPKHPSSPEECLRCGIIYSRYEQQLARRGVPIWAEDYPDR
jgi:hypothetical protein